MLALITLVSLVLQTQCVPTEHAIVRPMKDFSLQLFSGEWYRVGLAYESPLFVIYKNLVPVSKGLLVPDGGGGVNVTMWSRSTAGCKGTDYYYKKTDTLGEFVYYSKRHSIMKDITVVETNYHEYGLVVKYKQMNKEYSQVALYGRTSTLRPELIEKFQSYAQSLGFSKESIWIPSIVDSCPIKEESPRSLTIPTP